MRKYLTPFFSALPSVLIGTLIMSQYGVLINVYAQNIICLLQQFKELLFELDLV